MRSLRWKILLPALVLVAFGFAALGVSSYTVASGLIIDEAEDVAEAKLNGIVRQLDQKIDGWLKAVDSMAVTAAARSMDWGRVGELASNNAEIYSGFEMFLLADRQGAYRSTAGSQGTITDRDYFIKAISGARVISEPVVSRATGEAVIVIASPIRNARGQVIGVLAGTVQLAEISALVNSEEMGEGGYAYMIDSQGLIIAHPDDSLVLKYSFLNHESADLVKVTQNMIAGKTGKGDYTFNGEKKFSAYTPLQVNGWSVAMTAQYSHVTAGVGELMEKALFYGCGCILVTSLAVGGLVARLLAPIGAISKLAERVAGGDLTVSSDFKSEDEIGRLARSFNDMVKHMRGLLSEIRDMSMTVAASSQQMMASSHEASRVSEQISLTITDLATGSGEQAASAEQGNLMVKDMTEGVREIVARTASSRELTAKAAGSVQAGTQAVAEQRSKLVDGRQTVGSAGAVVKDLSSKSEQIGQIVEVINSIAAQTNLLAINAAIEAAHAGEQGKGFAVVADEVRKLAEQSRQATNQISELIQQIQVGVDQAVSEMQRVELAFGEQEVVAAQTASAFEGIMTAANGVIADIEQVAEAATELTEKAEATESSIENIASIIQESAAGAEEVAASTEEQTAAMQEIAASAENLAKLANRLQEVLQRFIV